MPRVRHPDWLHKKLLEKNDVYKQKKINELFTSEGKRQVKRVRERCWLCWWGFSPATPVLLLSFLPQVLANQPPEGTPNSQIGDIEDFGSAKTLQPLVPIANKRKRVPAAEESQQMSQYLELSQSWREILGPPPPLGTTKVGEKQTGQKMPWGCASPPKQLGCCQERAVGLLKPSARPQLRATRRNITRRWRNITTDREKGGGGCFIAGTGT